MYILLILFFISLLGIIIMIGRKMVLLKNGQGIVEEEVAFEVPYIKEIKHVSLRSIEKYGHLGLVAALRFYVKSSIFIKNQYQEAKTRLKNIKNKYQNNGNNKTEDKK